MTETRVCCFPCEAEEHTVGCNGRGESVDHFTPKCIGKLLGWTHSKLNEPLNLQHLSLAEHRVKDRDTAKRAEVLKRGNINDFEEHIRIFLGEDYALKHRRMVMET